MSSRRVLVVLSSYAPAMPASMHRGRMLAWNLPQFGWEIEILSPSLLSQSSDWLDSSSQPFFNPRVASHRAPPGRGSILQLLGVRSIGWRELMPMHRKGVELLSRRRFDLVYISTTAFNLFCLGRAWRMRLGIPYILDFQDPWFQSGPLRRTTQSRWKRLIVNASARSLESLSVRGADGLVAVSPSYLSQLSSRYPDAPAIRGGSCMVSPFPGRSQDFTDLSSLESRRDPNSRTIAYVGVGGALMEKSFHRLACALSRLRSRRPELVNRCQLKLLGTQGGWQAGDRKILWEVAREAGIADLVSEDPRIVPFSGATSLAALADGLIVLGVDDPAYIPSKLFPYAFTEAPLLASLHVESQASRYFSDFPELGHLLSFPSVTQDSGKEDRGLETFVEEVVLGQRFARLRVKESFSAEAHARRHADFFNACLARRSLTQGRLP